MISKIAFTAVCCSRFVYWNLEGWILLLGLSLLFPQTYCGDCGHVDHVCGQEECRRCGADFPEFWWQ